MLITDKQSVFKLIEDGIKAQLIPAIRKELIEILMKEQQERIEKLVDEKLIDVSLAHVESFRDALRWRDEIHLHINGVEINESMHKLKNKHTGEVATTPYLAEVEEYLKSGDYEMKKPVYTKEMKKNGDIEVGMIYLNEDNQKCELIGVNGKSFIGRFTELTVHYSHLDISSIDECKPIPTIEEELFGITSRFIGREMTQADLVCELLDKYNITPK